MANTLVDCRFEFLTLAGYEGAVNDKLYSYWLAQGGTGGTLNDAWFSALGVLGRTEGTLTDRWFEYLGSLGYEGSINDREKEYWCDLANNILVVTDTGTEMVTDTDTPIVL